MTWFGLEVAPFVGPVALWLALILRFQAGKSLSNFGVEGMIVLLVCAVGLGCRLYLFDRRYSARHAVALGCAACAVAVAAWAFMPSLPE